MENTTQTKHNDLVNASYLASRNYRNVREVHFDARNLQAEAAAEIAFNTAHNALRRFEERHPEVVS